MAEFQKKIYVLKDTLGNINTSSEGIPFFFRNKKDANKMVYWLDSKYGDKFSPFRVLLTVKDIVS